MLQLVNVNTYYGAIQALHDVSIQVKTNEIVTIIGANGAGKTTLIMTICGSPRLQSGKILFQNQDISQMPTHTIMNQGIALSPEGRRVFKDMTVLENLKMGAFHLSAEKTQEGIEYAFELFPRLKERALQRAGTMSGGEQQMLAIGRALMSQPKLLLLDEPTLGLAPLIIKQIFEIILAIREKGITILLVEQNANKALQIADRGYVLENGHVILEDTGSTLLSNDAVRKAYLGG